MHGLRCELCGIEPAVLLTPKCSTADHGKPADPARAVLEENVSADAAIGLMTLGIAGRRPPPVDHRNRSYRSSTSSKPCRRRSDARPGCPMARYPGSSCSTDLGCSLPGRRRHRATWPAWADDRLTIATFKLGGAQNLRTRRRARHVHPPLLHQLRNPRPLPPGCQNGGRFGVTGGECRGRRVERKEERDRTLRAERRTTSHCCEKWLC